MGQNVVIPFKKRKEKKKEIAVQFPRHFLSSGLCAFYSKNLSEKKNSKGKSLQKPNGICLCKEKKAKRSACAPALHRR
jgi:hypothetical protein